MRKIALAISLLGIMAGCGVNEEKTSAKIAHKKWLISLNDTVDSLSNVITEINEAVLQHSERIDSLLALVDVVNEPVLVEKYTVAKGWINYDLMQQGVFLRMLEDNTLELKATSKGHNFESIEIASSSDKAVSDTVKHDQAMNYRVDGSNIVAFTGKSVPALCKIVSDNKDGVVKMTFVGKSRKTIELTAKQKDMISTVYGLWSEMTESNRKQLMLPILSEKIQLIQTKINASGVEKNNE